MDFYNEIMSHDYIWVRMPFRLADAYLSISTFVDENDDYFQLVSTDCLGWNVEDTRAYFRYGRNDYVTIKPKNKGIDWAFEKEEFDNG
jgi:hypothetical protein